MLKILITESLLRMKGNLKVWSFWGQPRYIVKITFNTGIRVNDKTPSIVKNISGALVNKKELMISSKEIDAVKNSDI